MSLAADGPVRDTFRVVLYVCPLIGCTVFQDNVLTSVRTSRLVPPSLLRAQ